MYEIYLAINVLEFKNKTNTYKITVICSKFKLLIDPALGLIAVSLKLLQAIGIF